MKAWILDLSRESLRERILWFWDRDYKIRWGRNKARISKKKSIHFIKQKLVSIYQKLLSYMFAI